MHITFSLPHNQISIHLNPSHVISIEETTKQEIAANEADELVAMEAHTNWEVTVKNAAKK